MSNGLEHLKREVVALRQSTQGGRVRPHKLALLLAVLDLMDSGLVSDNRIYFDSDLATRFAKYFEMLSESGEWSRPERPFYHLKSSGFWRHKVRDGKEENYAAIKVADSKPIKECIEYSYFEEPVFELLKQTQNRDELRGFIMRIAASNDEKSQSLSFTFHRGFPLMRNGVLQVLRQAEKGASLSKGALHKATTLGSSQAEAIPRYAQRAGLLNSDGTLTPFGQLTLKHDPAQSRSATQWLMHYFMAAPHRHAPNFWAYLTVKCLHDSGSTLDKKIITQHLFDFAIEHSARAVKADSVDQVWTALTGTYKTSNSDSLGGLGILEESEKGRYLVREERAAVPLGAVACALGDFWAARFGEAKQVNLSDVTGPDGLAPLLLLSRGELNRLLGQLQARSLVTLQSVTPPYQIGREWADPALLWEHLHEL